MDDVADLNVSNTSELALYAGAISLEHTRYAGAGVALTGARQSGHVFEWPWLLNHCTRHCERISSQSRTEVHISNKTN